MTTTLDFYIGSGCTEEEALKILEGIRDGTYPFTPLSPAEAERNKKVDDWLLFADENSGYYGGMY